MTFKEAKENLIKMAGEKYCLIKYEQSVFAGETEVMCWLYVEKIGYSSGSTWESALSILKDKMGLIPTDESEAPNECPECGGETGNGKCISQCTRWERL